MVNKMGSSKRRVGSTSLLPFCHFVTIQIGSLVFFVFFSDFISTFCAKMCFFPLASPFFCFIIGLSFERKTSFSLVKINVRWQDTVSNRKFWTAKAKKQWKNRKNQVLLWDYVLFLHCLSSALFPVVPSCSPILSYPLLWVLSLFFHFATRFLSIFFVFLWGCCTFSHA